MSFARGDRELTIDDATHSNGHRLLCLREVESDLRAVALLDSCAVVVDLENDVALLWKPTPRPSRRLAREVARCPTTERRYRFESRSSEASVPWAWIFRVELSRLTARVDVRDHVVHG